MRGGRNFSRRQRSGDGDYGNKFRGSNNSFRDNSSGGRFNDHNVGRRFNTNDNFTKNSSSGRNRSRYDRRSPSDRFSSRNGPRDESNSRKRPRHEGNSSRRGEYGSSMSHNRHHSNGDGGRSSSNHRNIRRPSPPSKPNESIRHANNDKGLSVRARAPPVRPARKFSAKRPIREKIDNGRRAGRRGLLVRSNIIRRRDAARRAKLMRSSLKKRDVAIKKTVDEGKEEKNESKNMVEDSAEKSAEMEDEQSKKKASKNELGSNEHIDNDNTLDDNDQEMIDAKADGDEDGAAGESPAEESDAIKIEKSENDKDSKKKRLEDKDKKKKFVRLLCPHCRIECATFRDYNKHLHSRGHKSVLGRYGLRQKTRLARMRLAQRNAQRQLEEESKDTEKFAPQFCLLCRLNYRSPKEDHQASESHRKMKQFLMPLCETCDATFKSPMAYEIHRCSLEHLRRKAKKVDDKESEIEDTEDTELQVDLDSFMTVDSIGDVDGSEFSLNDDSDESPNEKTSKPFEKNSGDINVGNEHVKKVEVMFCELCRYYLPHLEDTESALQKHCSTRNHLRAYLRYKENQSLKMTAEMIHRRDNKKNSSKNSNPNGKSEDLNSKTDDETNDKEWEDTDKDCDQTTNIENNNEDEDDASVERFDRFKNSEKTDDENTDEIAAEKIDEGSNSDAVNKNGVEPEVE